MVQQAQARFIEQFRINDCERWDWEQDSGLLIFSHQGKPQVETKISFVGSFSEISNTWMWAWANESFTESNKQASRTIRELGEQHGFMKLVAAIWPGEQADGEEVVDIMAAQLGAIGIYRTADEHGYTYMIIESARWVNE